MPSLYEKIAQYENTSLNALYYENKTISYKLLLKNIRRMVGFFKKHNINETDVVTLVLPNIPVTIYSIYALNAIGVRLNIVHPLSTRDSIIESMKITNSKHVILLATCYEEFKDYINDSKYCFYFTNPMYDNNILMRNLFYIKYTKIKESNNCFLLDKFYKCKPCFEFVSKDNDLDSIFLHSGGTTGTPKTICLSNNAINNLVEKVPTSIIYEGVKGKSMLAVLPSFHGFGLAMGIHAPLSNGACSALMLKFNSSKVIKWINQNKINYIIGVPMLYQKLIKNEKFSKSKLTNLEYCFIGGDNVNTSLITSFNELMKNKGSNCMLLEGYGLTETVTVCSVNTKKDFKVGSVGKPLNNIEFVILDDKQKLVKANEVGEVYISGDTLMNSYLNDKTQTENTLINLNDKLWVKTGDLGYLDEEGFLFLKGRIKRIFKISGINVYPSEIEKIVCQIDDIFDASVEYIESNSSLELFVILNKDSLKDKESLVNEIYSLLNSKLLKYSIPSKITFIESFPKTKVGKIDHKALIEKVNG